MIVAAIGWNQQKENQIDRLFINRVEGDRLLQFGEQAEEFIQARDACMGQSNPLTEPSRAEIFTRGTMMTCSSRIRSRKSMIEPELLAALSL
jgi:hypothetical protein